MPEMRDQNGTLLVEGQRVSVLFKVAQEMLRGYDLVDVAREAPLAGSTAESPQYTVVRFMIPRDDCQVETSPLAEEGPPRRWGR